MKDSGIDWLGQISEHWMVFPLKYVATFNDETLSENTPPDFEFNYVDISSVKYGRGIVDREKITFEEAPSRARRVIQKGDTVISTVRTYLKSIATVEDDEENLIASTGFAVFRPNDSLSKEYFGYLAASSGLVGQIVAMSVGVSYPATNAYNIAQLRVPIPPADEQKEIANFLDEKTAHIDGLIEKKRKLLKLLAEKRSAIITNAVTKGINPEAPMKDSGIDWLGQIPEHWMVFPLKYVATFNDETLSENTPPDFEFNYVDISSVKYGRGIVDREKITFEEAPSRARRVIQKGDTVISTVRTYLKSIATVEDDEENLIASTGFAVFRPNDSLSKEYFGYLAASSGLVGQIVAMSVGVSYPATNAYNIAQLRVPIPPADEQNAIETYIKTNLSKTDVTSEKVKEVIEYLQEYRSALITEAVTGKIKVA